jgi:quinol monooxygenase YgiN
MSEVTLTVRLRAKGDQAAELEAVLRSAVGPSHADGHCLRYAVHRSSQDHNVYLLIERWTSQAALDRHLAQPFLREMLAKAGELAEPATVEAFEMITEGDPRKLL